MAIFLFSIIGGLYLTFAAFRLFGEQDRILATAAMMPNTFLSEVSDAQKYPIRFWFGVLLSCWIYIVIGSIAFYLIYDDWNYGYEKILLWPFIAALVCVIAKVRAYSVYTNNAFK